MKINKDKEWFKIVYEDSYNKTHRVENKYGAIWFKYDEAKKIFDDFANPQYLDKNTIHWIELIYFPEDADDGYVLEDWELTKEQRRTIELLKSLQMSI